MYLTASPTVRIVSAASSGISTPNSSSNAMTSSTVSRLSAPRSSMKLAPSVTLSASTPRCSTTIFLTRSAVSLICKPSTWCWPATRHLRWSVFVSGTIAANQAERWNPPAGAVNSRRRNPAGADHRHAAVDVQVLAGDVAGAVGGAIERGGSYVVACPHLFPADRAHDRLALLVVQLVGHGRLDEAGGDAVDGDAARGDLLRQ